jgi:hypothetical protein
MRSAVASRGQVSNKPKQQLTVATGSFPATRLVEVVMRGRAP